MDFKEEWISLIDRYLRGELDKDGREEFDMLLTGDDEFREQLSRQNALAEALHIQSVLDREKKIRAVEAELLQDSGHQSELRHIRARVKRRQALLNIASKAALIAISFALGALLFYSRDTVGPVAQNRQTVELPAGVARPVIKKAMPLEIYALEENGSLAKKEESSIVVTILKDSNKNRYFYKTREELIIEDKDAEALASSTLFLIEIYFGNSGNSTFLISIDGQVYDLKPQEEEGHFRDASSISLNK